MVCYQGGSALVSLFFLLLDRLPFEKFVMLSRVYNFRDYCMCSCACYISFVYVYDGMWGKDGEKRTIQS
jgi:hypothetical protein